MVAGGRDHGCWDMVAYTVYVLQSGRTGWFYVGATGDLCRRRRDHNAGRTKSTRGKGPWQVVYEEHYGNRAEALRRERQIKGMKSREYVQQLVNSRDAGQE